MNSIKNKVGLSGLWKRGFKEKIYDVNRGKADIHPLRKFFAFVPIAVVLSSLAILASVYTAPAAMDFVKEKLDSVYSIGKQEEFKAAPPEILFTDVNDYSMYYNSLSFLKKKGIVSGFSDGSFKPELPIKRAELVKTIVIAKKQFPLALNYNHCFKDVNTEWFAPSVCFAKSSGWISGFEDGTFRPDETLSRANVEKLLAKAFELKDHPEDVVSDHPEGVEPPITRGEAFEMLYHVLQ